MPGDVLAVEVDDQAQDAVRGRVVGPEVDGQDVLEVVLGRIDLEHGRDRAGDTRPLVDLGAGDDGHLPAVYSSPEKRTGSPPRG